MNSVTITETFEADIETIDSIITDIKPFLEGAGFDAVTIENRQINITNHVGLLEISLALKQIEKGDATLAFKQIDGIFSEMETYYSTIPTEDGTKVTAHTDFELDKGVVGSFLNATIVTAQRKRELRSQMKYIKEQLPD
ncbi:MAG: SRPBCC family protein [Halobacteriaceae archaeon]